MPQACNFIKKETLAQVFSCEFCKISKNTFFTEHLWTTASNNRTLRLVGAFFSLTLNASRYTKQSIFLTGGSFSACYISTRFAFTSFDFQKIV